MASRNLVLLSTLALLIASPAAMAHAGGRTASADYVAAGGDLGVPTCGLVDGLPSAGCVAFDVVQGEYAVTLAAADIGASVIPVRVSFEGPYGYVTPVLCIGMEHEQTLYLPWNTDRTVVAILGAEASATCGSDVPATAGTVAARFHGYCW